MPSLGDGVMLGPEAVASIRGELGRTRAGLAAAKRSGRTGGRPPKMTEHDVDVAKTLLANPDISVADIAGRPGVSPATLYRYLPAARTAHASSV
jgi:DNA invertase Pin-like site-specific DNA recombinase